MTDHRNDLVQSARTLTQVSAVCILLSDPQAIPDDLETALYAYADQLVAVNGAALAGLHLMYQTGPVRQFGSIVRDLVKQHADTDG